MILSPIIFLLPVAVLSVPIDDYATLFIKSYNITTQQDYPGICQLEYHRNVILEKIWYLVCHTMKDPWVKQKCMVSEIKRDDPTVLFITGIDDGKSFYKSYYDCPSFRSVHREISSLVKNRARGFKPHPLGQHRPTESTIQRDL